MSELIVVGDRVLIDPDSDERQTDSGLLLPATVAERERVGSGTVVLVGPGHLIPNPDYSEGETWGEPRSAGRYLPLQAEIGDMAYFLRKEAIEMAYKSKKYLILPHNAIVALVRPNHEDLLDELLDSSSRL